MADPQEFNSLDELFRKTFEDLPDTPAASGWDSPSPRVWEQVRVRLMPPNGGWSAQALLLVGGLAVALMLGLYWTIARPGNGTSTPSVNTTSTAAAPIANPETAPALPLANTTAPQPAGTNMLPPAPSSAQNGAANTASAQRRKANQRRPDEVFILPGSLPLPGTHPVLPNTTVRRHAEQWRSAPWAQPLPILPSVLQRQTIRPVPDGLKNIGK